jgi:hypothetical protein
MFDFDRFFLRSIKLGRFVPKGPSENFFWTSLFGQPNSSIIHQIIFFRLHNHKIIKFLLSIIMLRSNVILKTIKALSIRKNLIPSPINFDFNNSEILNARLITASKRS